MTPYEAITLIALLLAIASEGLDFWEEREDRMWARMVERMRANSAVATGSGRRNYPPVGPTPNAPPPPTPKWRSGK